jgi:hypothetical protein
MKTKNLGGRPPAYTNNSELHLKVEEYFDSTPFSEWGLSGLAYHLGFSSRQSLYDYEKKEEFNYVIKRAQLRIESKYEKNLSNPKIPIAGTIFALKRMGWVDENTEDKTVIIKIVRDSPEASAAS